MIIALAAIVILFQITTDGVLLKPINVSNLVVQNAQILAQTQRVAAQLKSTLETRAVVDRAVGIMMSRSGGTEHEALERLRAMSQHEHQKLALVARQIVDEAVRRAEARHRSDWPDLP